MFFFGYLCKYCQHRHNETGLFFDGQSSRQQQHKLQPCRADQAAHEHGQPAPDQIGTPTLQLAAFHDESDYLPHIRDCFCRPAVFILGEEDGAGRSADDFAEGQLHRAGDRRRAGIGARRPGKQRGQGRRPVGHYSGTTSPVRQCSERRTGRPENRSRKRARQAAKRVRSPSLTA